MNAVMPSSWWAGVPPVEVTVDCRGRSHRLRWEAGELATPDHPGAGRRPPVKKGDPPRSAAGRVGDDLSAQGCVAVARGWRAYGRDPRTLVLGRRHPGETLNREAAIASQDPLARLLAELDPALERRLQLEAADVMARRWSAGSTDAAVLEAATVGRVGKALERWLPPEAQASVRLGSRSQVTEVHVAEAQATDVTASAEGVDDRAAQVVVTLAPTWLAEVWGRYLTVVDSFLVLEVGRIVDDRAEVIALGRPGGARARLTLRGPAPWRAVDRQPLEP